jgi:hypothetical protein
MTVEDISFREYPAFADSIEIDILSVVVRCAI